MKECWFRAYSEEYVPKSYHLCPAIGDPVITCWDHCASVSCELNLSEILNLLPEIAQEWKTLTQRRALTPEDVVLRTVILYLIK